MDGRDVPERRQRGPHRGTGLRAPAYRNAHHAGRVESGHGYIHRRARRSPDRTSRWASSGDYFELTGKIIGSTLSNFIATLNSQGNADYMIFHQIVLSEQIGLSFRKTSEQMFTQTQDFDLPILYRPIISHSATAVSFAINYNMRLYNKADNTQIIKQARYVSYDPKKYGRRLMKINLGTVPTVANVYNELGDDSGNQIIVGGAISNNANMADKITENLVVKTRFNTTFRDRINVKASMSTVKVENITGA